MRGQLWPCASGGGWLAGGSVGWGLTTDAVGPGTIRRRQSFVRGKGQFVVCRGRRSGKLIAVICVVFAVLTAFSNALASVLQRRAASEAPADGAFRLSLFSYLVRRRGWL